MRSVFTLRRRLRPATLLGWVLSFLVATELMQQQSLAQTEDEELTRTIYVPFEDLHHLLQGQTERVFMTREEYRDLKRSAEQQPTIEPSRDYLIAGSTFEGTVQQAEMTIQGQLEIEVLSEGWHEIPIPLQGVRVLRAMIDDQGAPLVMGDDQQVRLLVNHAGRYRLDLLLSTPVQVAAAQQSLQFQLPFTASSALEIRVPGNVEVKSGAHVVAREYLEDSDTTRFELVPIRGPMSLTMSLNNKRLQDERLVAARSVFVSELTTAYERLHATVSYQVMQGVVDRLSLELPKEYQVVLVETPLMERWRVVEEDDVQRLEIELLSPTRESQVVRFSAIKMTHELANWKMPLIAPNDVVSSVALLGLLSETRLQPTNLQASDLVPLGSNVLDAALPRSVLEAEPGAPEIQPIAAYYAAGSEYELTAAVEEPSDRFDVASQFVLSVGEANLEVEGGFEIRPIADKLKSMDFELPADWVVEEVRCDDRALASIEQIQAGENLRVHIVWQSSVGVDESSVIRFRARQTSSEWLTDWQQQAIEFPAIQAIGAAIQRGALSVRAVGDMTIRATNVDQLTLLDSSQRERFGLSDSTGELAFRFSSPEYQLQLEAIRATPFITSRNYTFFMIRDGLAKGRYEVVFDVERAAKQTLELVLPADTPRTLSFSGVDSTSVKASSLTVDGDLHRWSIRLEQPMKGRVHLAASFNLPLVTERLNDWSVPLIRSSDAAFQNQMVAIEGSPELNIDIQTEMRRVDVGELAEATYLPGSRLLGAFDAAEGSPQIALTSRRYELRSLPPVIVERAEMVTAIAPNGIQQTFARYWLRTKESFIEIELPDESNLWTVMLDQQPIRAQRSGRAILLTLPSQQTEQLVDLQVAYESAATRFALSGTIEAQPPKLLFKHALDDGQREIPQADLVWHLYLPDGYRISRTSGTLYRLQETERASLLGRLATTSDQLGGGIRKHWGGAIGGIGSEATDMASFETNQSVVQQNRALPDAPAMPKSSAQFEGGFDEWMDLEEEAMDGAEPGLAGNLLPPGGPDQGVPSGGAARNSGRGEASSPSPNESTASEADQDSSSVPFMSDDSSRDAEDRREALAGKLWALQGLAPLEIEFQPNSDPISFSSVGEQPRLSATIIDQRRVDLLGWGTGLSILIIGLLFGRASNRLKSTYFFVCLGAVLGLPLVGGLFWDYAAVFDRALYGVLLLLPLFAMTSVVRILGRLKVNQTAAATLLVAVCFVAGDAIVGQAQDSDDASTPPVAVPDDAIIIPYDPSGSGGAHGTDQILIPYAEYQRLWNLAFPQQQLDGGPRAEFAIAGSSYQVRLDPIKSSSDKESLLFRGELEIELFDEETHLIPLGARNAIITAALLDGESATLSLLNVDPGTESQPNQSRANTPNPQPANAASSHAILGVRVTGKGRHRLELSVQVGLERQGGWLVTNCQLPVGPAAEIEADVLQAGTQLRFNRQSVETNRQAETDNQSVQLSTWPDGTLQFSWRPPIDEAMVDQGLTVEAIDLLYVDLAGLQLRSRLNYRFGRSERGSLSFEIPRGFVLEGVRGVNVRGWQTREQAEVTAVDVQLLKPVRQSETIDVVISRAEQLELDSSKQIDAPAITVREASLHRGTYAIKRSQVLQLRTLSIEGASRTSVDMNSYAPLLAGDESVALIPRAEFQSFVYNASPLRIKLEARTGESSADVKFQTIWRVGETESTVESHIIAQTSDTATTQWELQLPAGLTVDAVEGVNGIWAIDDSAEPHVLRAFLWQATTLPVEATVLGHFPEHAPDESIEFPRFHFQNAKSQSGEMVIQVDPSLEATPEELVGLKRELPRQVESWLVSQQRSRVRLVFSFDQSEIQGKLQLTPKTPRVSCDSFTNVRTTYRAIEETLLLDFLIEEAGIRELRFQLPAYMAQSPIQATMLREVTTEAIENSDKVRVTLQLQDSVIGSYRVVISHDRALASAAQPVPLAIVETGDHRLRYMTIQNAGRDEIEIDEAASWEPLSRGQSQWQSLSDRLGGGDVTMAFVSSGNDASAESFRYRSNRREIVETSGASIGLAETTMIVDSAGGYRAAQVYHVNNRTEPFLEILLPESAQLWTAYVAEEPVKPATTPGGDPQSVRIPLVKTAEGDLDYEVVIKYAGSLGELSAWDDVEFPFVRTVNINVELSQVRLYLPPSHQWFGFEGSAVQVNDEAELEARYVSYQTAQVERLRAALVSKNSFSVSRARDSLQEIEASKLEFESNARVDNDVLSASRLANSQALETAAREAAELAYDDNIAIDNRSNLNSYFREQSNDLAKNQIQRFGNNFSNRELGQGIGRAQSDDLRATMNLQFLETNGLLFDQDQVAQNSNQPQTGGLRGGGGFGGGGQQGGGEDLYGRYQAGAEQARRRTRNDAFNSSGRIINELADRQLPAPQQPPSSESGDGEALNLRYQQRLAEQTAPSLVLGRQPDVGNLFNPTQELDFGQEIWFNSSYVGERGLASLDVELQERGTLYMFTMPRGEVEIKARAVERSQFQRMIDSACLLGLFVGLGLVWSVYRRVAKYRAGRGLIIGLLLLVAMVSLLGGYWPWAGLLIGLTGFYLLVAAFIDRKRPAPEPAST